MLNKRLTDFERTFINPRGIYPQRQVCSTEHVS